MSVGLNSLKTETMGNKLIRAQNWYIYINMKAHTFPYTLHVHVIVLHSVTDSVPILLQIQKTHIHTPFTFRILFPNGVVTLLSP